MSTSYLMIPDSCDRTGGGSVCLCVCVPILKESERTWLLFIYCFANGNASMGLFSPSYHCLPQMFSKVFGYI